MAYDEAVGMTVLFGGIARNQKPLGDTWLFDGDTWRPVPGPGPSARRYAAFAYDPELRGCVLNAGCDDDNGQLCYGDTWLFRDKSWKRMGSDFDTTVVDDLGMGYHRIAKRLVLFGGLRAGTDVRVRTPTGWTDAEAPPFAHRIQCSPLAWVDDLAGLVLHGGELKHGGPQLDATWVLKMA